MRKYILTIAFLLIFTVSMVGWPLLALAADELSFTEDTTISLDSGISFTVLSGSLADEMSVYTTYVTFTLSANSSVVIRSTERRDFTSSIGVTGDCNSSSTYSSLTLPAKASQTVATVTPGDLCPAWASSGGSGGGGGGAVETPTKPTTTTGEVTATASGGGKTTFTTTESATATVDLPANAVSASTTVQISALTKGSITQSRPLPSGKSIVGGYAYNFTATSGGKSVTTFLKNLTLTFAYTNSQIAGLNEDTLKVYYWDGSQWSILTSTVDKASNKVTATTNHFTYFTIIGESSAVVPPSTMAKPEDYGLTEGDLIRAQGDFDIFIINQYGYKRLFLNPAIFEMYGHLGSWSDVKTVTPETRDAFITSSHYRYVNEDKVYHLEVTGEDTGVLQWINMTAENFLSQGGKANAIFTINKSELDWYSKGADKTAL